ncbi:hypothetical protein CQB05_18840 [Paracidovorax citrulli]|nr:hypothetical protein CQB05_18840 [Paracidovorax citrulli]
MGHYDQFTTWIQPLQVAKFASNSIYRMTATRAKKSYNIFISISDGHDLDCTRHIQGGTSLFLPSCGGTDAVK